MRILVYPHLMEMGGSQLNAIELAAAVRDLGHEVMVFAPPGRLVPVARAMGLEVVEAPRKGHWPCRRNIRALNRMVSERGINLVHGYEWGPAIELAYGPNLRGVPMVITSMSMSIPGFLPRHVPLIVGTQELRDQQLTTRERVLLMEPPIDVRRFAPRDGGTARAALGLSPSAIVVSVVCRLTTDLGKLGGVLEAMTAVASLAARHDMQYLVVGEGPGLQEVRAAAGRVNRSMGRSVIVVTGGMEDPSPAYDAADIVIGMGSSALKGMSCAKPLVVQGSGGFWRQLDSSTVGGFLEAGWYGEGDGQDDLLTLLSALVTDQTLRQELGDFGRRLAVDRYSLDSASRDLIRIYSDAMAPPSGRAIELTRTSYELSKFKLDGVRRTWNRTRLDPPVRTPFGSSS